METELEIEQLRKERYESLKREAYLRSLCLAVRLAQVEYFATRSQESLIRSKGAESRLDKELFGAPLKFKNMSRGDNGEMVYDDGQQAVGDVSGNCKAKVVELQHPAGVRRSGKGTADDR